MDYSSNGSCPHCGKPLTPDKSGRIGFCKRHRWIAIGEENIGFAAQKNEEIKNEQTKAIERQEIERQEQKRIESEKEYHRNVRMIVTTICVIALICILAFFVLLRPKMIYSDAAEAYKEGNYSLALNKYEKIENYKDSNIRIDLCRFLSQISDEEAVVLNFTSLMNNELSDELVLEVQKTLNSWDDYSIRPVTILAVINIIDDERIETRQLYLDAHVKMLPSSIAYMVKETQNNTLVSLTSNLKVELYQMLENGNSQVYIDEVESVNYLIQFGKQFEDSNDYSKALECYLKAYTTAFDEKALDAAISVIDSLPTGVERVTQRYRIYKAIPQEKETESSTIKNLLSEDVISALSASNITNCSDTDIVSITKIVKAEKLDIKSIEIDTIYRNSALSLISDNLSSYQFTDFNSDGMEEVISLFDTGLLRYQDYMSSTDISYDTNLSNGTLSLHGKTILVKSGAADSFGIFTYEGDTIIQRTQERNVCNLANTDTELTYYKKLPGSIERLEYYRINLTRSPISSEKVRLDWNSESYSMPSTSEATVVRWLETVAYNIPQERKLLEKSGVVLNAPKPTDISSIKIITCYSENNNEYVLATYTASEGKKTALIFKCIINDQNHIIANIESAENNINIEDVLPANEELKGALQKENESITYTLVIPVASKLNLFWQSGDSNGSTATYNITLYKDKPEEPIFSYDLVETSMIQKSYPTFVEKGIYKVVVRSLTKKPKEYRFRIDALCVDNIEKEPNDNYDTATPLLIDNQYYGSLKTSTDKDFYSFELTSNSKVNVTVSSSEDGNKKDKFIFTVYDAESHKFLHQFKITGIADKAISSNLYLSKGKYLVLVEKGDYFSQEEYCISVSAASGMVQEVEDNDSRKTATELKLGSKITGSLAVSNDSDWYSFNLQSPMVIKTNLSFSPINSSSKTYVVTVLNNEGEIAKWSIGGNSTDVKLNSILLDKGDYFIRIDSAQYNPKDYSILLTGERVDYIEEEPNNKSSSANTLQLNQTFTGYSSDVTDIDCYKISLKEGNYLIEIAFDSSTGSSNRYAFSIEKDGTTLYRQSIKDNSGGFSSLFGFEDGDYILKLQPSYEVCDVYSLRVSKK